MVHSWEKALDRFLLGWKGRKYVKGAVVCGSRITGTATRFSDIDVHIVMDDKIKWRERGLKIVDGYLIEYLANPARMYRKYYAEGSTANSRSVARMFAQGRVIFDKDGTVARVVRWARHTIPKPFRRPDRMSLENAKYRMWDSLDGLQDLVARRSPGFWHSYYLAFDGVIEQYGRHVGAESGAPSGLGSTLPTRDTGKPTGSIRSPSLSLRPSRRHA